jgi:hypothetical protein
VHLTDGLSVELRPQVAFGDTYVSCLLFMSLKVTSGIYCCHALARGTANAPARSTDFVTWVGQAACVCMHMHTCQHVSVPPTSVRTGPADVLRNRLYVMVVACMLISPALCASVCMHVVH